MIKLTQTECDNLSIGSHVRVLWSGGNGPHDYVVVAQHPAAVVSERDYENGCIDMISELVFVGEDSPFTVVWMVD